MYPSISAASQRIFLQLSIVILILVELLRNWLKAVILVQMRGDKLVY